MAAVIQSNVAAHTHPAPARFNMYAIIHKGLRAFMTDTLLRWGRMDVQDDAERAQAIEQARALLAMLDGHWRHENAFVHVAIERARPGFTSRAAHEHVEHERAIRQLMSAVDEFERTAADQLPTQAHALYLQLSAFVGENLEHMVFEETEHQAALIAAYSDQELLAIHDAIVSSLSPEETFAGLRWMIPNINANERAGMLAGMKQGAPTEVFDAVMALAREVLSQRDYYKLERALGV